MPKEITFNFHGLSLSTEPQGGLFSPASQPIDLLHEMSKSTVMPAIFEIDGRLEDGHLQLSILVNKKLSLKPRVQTWFQTIHESIAAAAQRLAGSSPGGFTPGDFPLLRNRISLDSFDTLFNDILPDLDVYDTENIDGIDPCTSLQQMMWLSGSRENGYYQLFFIWELSERDGGLVDGGRIMEAWTRLVQR